ncbi:hypothetical protein [Duganella sp. BuS-21]|uniref:hypothetical protein n=1 Tax=Duganella sp. BuS-21 TaxID=2943848 RepID=UPI0035A6BCDB
MHFSIVKLGWRQQSHHLRQRRSAPPARWVWLGSIAKIAVAVSSGSAALAGLVFWKNSDYTFLWPMFTSASALLAIISKQLSVAEKLKSHAASVTELSDLLLTKQLRVNAQAAVNQTLDVQ